MGTDCTDSCQSNCYAIMTSTAPATVWNIIRTNNHNLLPLLAGSCHYLLKSQNQFKKLFQGRNKSMHQYKTWGFYIIITALFHTYNNYSSASHISFLNHRIGICTFQTLILKLYVLQELFPFKTGYRSYFPLRQASGVISL